MQGLAVFVALSAVAFAAPWPDFTRDGAAAVKSWASQRILAAEQNFSRAGFQRFSSPASWAGKTVFQIQVDRFNNGDLSNDELNLPPSQVRWQHTPDLHEIHHWRHHGDLAGIRQRLDYLVDLGVNVLWLTPILHHDGSYRERSQQTLDKRGGSGRWLLLD